METRECACEYVHNVHLRWHHKSYPIKCETTEIAAGAHSQPGEGGEWQTMI